MKYLFFLLFIPIIGFSQTNCDVCPPGALLNPQATGSVDYLWSTTETTPTIQVSASGTYMVTISDQTDPTCLVVETFNVTVNPEPVPSFSIADYCSGEIVTSQVTVTNGTAPYTYTISGGTATINSSGLITSMETNAGPVRSQSFSYNLVVTDANGCTGDVDVSFNVLCAQTGVLTSVEATCGDQGEVCISGFLNKDGNGSIEISLDGGSTYEPSFSEAATIICYDVDAGVYNVWIRWGNDSCPVDLGSVTVNEIDPPTCLATSNSPVCEGSDIMLEETSGDAVSWSWTGPNGFTSTTQNPTITGATPAMAGTYTVEITDANGCTTECDVEVVVTTGPTTNPICTQL